VLASSGAAQDFQAVRQSRRSRQPLEGDW
jgi:hypothetical protein